MESEDHKSTGSGGLASTMEVKPNYPLTITEKKETYYTRSSVTVRPITGVGKYRNTGTLAPKKFFRSAGSCSKIKEKRKRKWGRRKRVHEECRQR